MFRRLLSRREDDHHADRCKAGGDHVRIPEQVLNFACADPRKMTRSMSNISASPMTPVSAVPTVTSLANCQKALSTCRRDL